LLLDDIFGDALRSNGKRLSNETLKNPVEHFSTQMRSAAHVSEDELGWSVSAAQHPLQDAGAASPSFPRRAMGQESGQTSMLISSRPSRRGMAG